jgi:hypothetical protein
VGPESAGLNCGDIFQTIFENAVAPTTRGQLTVCYLVWVSLFLTINIVWDIRTPRTPPFHLAGMKDKVPVAYDAATFCSSILIIAALVNESVRALDRDVTIPLVIAAFSGFLRAVPALCPYSREAADQVGKI